MASSVDAQPTLLDGEDMPGLELRRALPGAIIPNAGIVRGLKVAALPTPDMKVRVPAGLCMVDDGEGGLCPLYLETQADLDVAASSATLARIDSVIAEFVDTGDGATLFRRFRIITGTPASSPTAPALPPSDAPTAKTLRLANVFVQPNAEVNGKVRAQDVTLQAVAASLVPRPQQTLQVNDLEDPTPAPGTWTDFTTGQWPRITFTVPSSGMAHVTIGAECHNDHTASSNTRVSFRLSGGYTLAAGFGHDAGGHISAIASRRYLITGMTPGSIVTITPAYRLSSLANPPDESAYVHSGNLIVEPVA